MNAARILVALAQPNLGAELDALLREVFGAGGALEIADQAAWEMIMCECRCFEMPDGRTYYQVHAGALELDLADEEEREIAHQVARAVNYLGRRELLHTYNGQADLVALKESA